MPNSIEQEQLLRSLPPCFLAVRALAPRFVLTSNRRPQVGAAMQLRQNRRRRVLSEESATSDRRAGADGRSLEDAAPARTKHASYSPAVEREQARAVLDLLPRRYLTLA